MTHTVISAKDGYILTNGEIFGRTIYLSNNTKKEDFYEITIAEYYEIQKKLSMAEMEAI